MDGNKIELKGYQFLVIECNKENEIVKKQYKIERMMESMEQSMLSVFVFGI